MLRLSRLQAMSGSETHPARCGFHGIAVIPKLPAVGSGMSTASLRAMSRTIQAVAPASIGFLSVFLTSCAAPPSASAREAQAAAVPVTHRIVGQDRGAVSIVAADGTLQWQVTCPHNSHDIAALPNGNMLIHPAPNRIVEITPSKEVVWQWTSVPVAPYAGPVEIHAFERLPDGNTMIVETGNLRIIEVDAQGAVRTSVPMRVEHPDAHRDTRRVRKTAAGTYLVCHEGLGCVREYNAAGAVVWEYVLDLNNQPAIGGHDGHGTCVFNALRLSNGNTLIGGGNNNRVIEVTLAGKVVWSIERDELLRADGRPIHLCWVTSLQVLPNGNVVIGNTHAGESNPQMVEVTRTKQVVWVLDNQKVFGNDLCTGWLLDAPAGTIR
jgi:hypothetical protein